MSPPAHEESTTISVNGHRLHTTSVGTGEPLLLIMGLGGNCDMWGPLLPHLENRRTIAFDAPGTGRSTTPTWPVSVPALADIAATVLGHYEIATSDVLGFSYGGAIAQQLAVQHPELVRRLVLVATTMGAGSVAGSPQATQELASPLRYYRTDLFEKSAASVYGGRVGRDAQVRSEMAKGRSAHPPSQYGYALQLMGGWGWTSKRFAADIEQPTLIISGDDDPLVPVQNAHQLNELIPNSELQVIAGGGHLLLLDQASEIASIIDDFLESP
jgi:pimeloyl-ACP methyl ester carboxylesterase